MRLHIHQTASKYLQGGIAVAYCPFAVAYSRFTIRDLLQVHQNPRNRSTDTRKNSHEFTYLALSLSNVAGGVNTVSLSLQFC